MSQAPPPKYKEYKDDWGTTAREGYEDRGAFRPPRPPQKPPGSPYLRVLGAICIVGAICWATYLLTRTGDITSVANITHVLQENHGPLAIAGLGVIASLLGKYLRV